MRIGGLSYQLYERSRMGHRRVVENERALWVCFFGGPCYAPDHSVCDCKLADRKNHDPGDEDRS